MAPQLIRNTDPGMPTLTGEVGSAYNLFKTVLPLLGWTIEFDSPEDSKIVFRNNPITGSGCYVRILDDGTHPIGHGARFFEINAYEEMTDIDTGSGPCRDTVGFPFKKSSELSATARNWFIVGDDRTFYYCAEQSSGMYFAGGVGDYHSVIPGMPGFMLTGAWAPASITDGAGGGWLAFTIGNRVSRNPATMGITPTDFFCNYSPMGNSNQGVVGVSGIPAARPHHNRRYCAPMIMGDNTSLGLIGVMRGAYVPIHVVTSLRGGDTFTSTSGADSIDFIVVETQASSNNTIYPSSVGYCFISLGDWD